MDELPKGYTAIEMLASIWNDELAERFPNADHSECSVRIHLPTLEIRGCVDWHCNRCGIATNPHAPHNCPDRVSQVEVGVRDTVPWNIA